MQFKCNLKLHRATLVHAFLTISDVKQRKLSPAKTNKQKQFTQIYRNQNHCVKMGRTVPSAGQHASRRLAVLKAAQSKLNESTTQKKQVIEWTKRETRMIREKPLQLISVTADFSIRLTTYSRMEVSVLTYLILPSRQAEQRDSSKATGVNSGSNNRRDKVRTVEHLTHEQNLKTEAAPSSCFTTDP